MKKQKGITLIELVTTVAIIGILAAVAVPAYDRYTRKTNRTAAKTALELVRAKVEGYYLNNKVYTSNMANLGFGGNTITINKAGDEVPAASNDGLYTIQVNAPGVFCPDCNYEVGAIPINGQLQDADCMTLFLNSRNQKGATGPGTNCW